MSTQRNRRGEWIWMCSACMFLMMALVAVAQDQPLPGNQRVPGDPMTPQMAQGPMGRGMQGPGMQGPRAPRQGMQGPGMRMANGPRMMQGRPDGGPGNPIAEILRPEVQKELAITFEQRQKLEDIRFNTEKESIQRGAASQVLRMELQRLAEADNPDRAAVDKKIQEVAQEEAALMKASINATLNAKAVLTAEQRAKLTQFRQNRREANRPPQGQGGAQPGQPAPKAGQSRNRVPQPAAPPSPREK
jgi:Spy/CpxP family protein refolding chaperone